MEFPEKFSSSLCRAVLSLVVSCAFSALIIGCSEADEARSGSSGPTTAPATVQIAPVRVDSAQRYVEAVGTLYGDEEATVAAKVSGRIAAVFHDVGDRVQPGQPLAQIEKRDYELALAQKQLAMREALSQLGLSELPSGDLDPDTVPTVRKARLAASNAEGRYQRGKQLHDQTPPRLSDQEFADLQTAWEVAQNEHQVQVLVAQSTLADARARSAEVQMSEQQLDDTTIRAPAPVPASTNPSQKAAEGREYAVIERMISVGEFVNSSSPAFRLIDDNPIKLRAAVPERFIDQIKTGQKVRVQIEAFAQPFVGTITRLNPQIDPANRNFRIEALIDNSDQLLKAGAFARAAIETRLEPEVLFVSQSAIVTFAGVNRVFVAVDGKAEERVVELGPRQADDVEIVKGVRSGDMIVVSGAGKLVPGTPLQEAAATQPAAIR